METVLIEELKGTGYGSELTRMHAYASVQLFAHRDIRGVSMVDKDKVLISKRRGDIVARGNFPPQYLISKARAGIFAWPPGETCLAHDFRHIKMLDGKVQKDPELHKGCPDCRSRPVEVVSAPAAVMPDEGRFSEYERRIKELEAKLQSQPQPQPKGHGKAEFRCPDCTRTFTSKGYARMHTERAHKKEMK